MAEPYLTRLAQIVDELGPLQAGGATFDSRHFFSGAALYADGRIFASLSPAGFALKLPAGTRRRLIAEGRGTEFRFFPNGPVKREYVALSDSTVANAESIRELITLSVDYAVDVPGRKSVAKSSSVPRAATTE